MTTDAAQVAAPDTSEEKPPQPASQEQPGAPPAEPAPEPEAKEPPPDPGKIREEAVAAIDDDTLAFLIGGLPQERYEKLFGTDIERRSQSRADRTDSDAKLEGDVARVSTEYGQRFFDLKQRVEQEEVRPILDEAAAQGRAFQDALHQRYLSNALGRLGITLTDEDRRRLDSVRGDGTDPQTRIRNTIEVYVNRAREIGRTEAPELVRKQAEDDAAVAEKMAKVLGYLKGGQEQAATREAMSPAVTDDNARLLSPDTPVSELMAIRARQRTGS